MKEPKDNSKKQIQLDLISQQIVDLLSNGEVHFDSICAAINQSASQTASSLTMLEIMGIIKKLSGNFYSLVY